MRNKGKGIILGAILGVGAGIVLRNVLKEKSVDDIKEDLKGNIHKATEVIKNNIGKAKDTIEEYKSENTSNVKIKL